MSPAWFNRFVARADVQARMARMPILRRIVRREGAEIFYLVQGFVQSQVLFALVSLDLFDLLDGKPLGPNELARAVDLPEDRMAVLLRAGAALGLLIAWKDGRFGLSRRGAALRGVPGLTDMIRHHGAFYSDMADPVALLRGEVDTELARFWPYVFGAASAKDPEAAARYSNLMARSQVMVAEDTLATVSLDGVSRLLDIGGGTGVFLSAAARRAPTMELALMELPPVLQLAREHLASEGHGGRFTGYPGSFRDDPIPEGADAISLVRVLYDHDEKSVRALLAKAHAALKPGGRLIVSEPMSGGARPDPITDVYFAFYTLAMQTGRTRSQAEIAVLCREAGFAGVETPKSLRPYITSVVTAHRDA